MDQARQNCIFRSHLFLLHRIRTEALQAFSRPSQGGVVTWETSTHVNFREQAGQVVSCGGIEKARDARDEAIVARRFHISEQTLKLLRLMGETLAAKWSEGGGGGERW